MTFKQLTTVSKLNVSFQSFCKLIQKKTLLTESRNFLTILEITVKPQILLTIYLISKYSKFVLNNDKLDENLLIVCNKIIENIDEYLVLLKKRKK